LLRALARVWRAAGLTQQQLASSVGYQPGTDRGSGDGHHCHRARVFGVPAIKRWPREGALVVARERVDGVLQARRRAVTRPDHQQVRAQWDQWRAEEVSATALRLATTAGRP
jgi:hypothetical protein